MATIRKKLTWKGHWQGYAFGTTYGYYDISKSFHPDHEIVPQDLKWNNGSGYPVSKCLNVKGNIAFEPEGFDWYIGRGSPGDSEYLNNVLAGSLTSCKLGCVFGWSHQRNWNYLSASQGDDYEKYSTLTQTDFTEYSQSASVNNSSWGEIVLKTGISGSSFSYKNANASFDFGPTNADSSNYIFAGGYPSVSEKNGAKFLGVYLNGAFTTFGDIRNRDYSGAIAVFGLPFSVIYDSNGGSGTISSSNFYGGVSDYKSQQLNANTFTRSGYTFVGWSLSSSATTADFADKSSADAVFEAAGASAGDTITLYAVWVSIKLRKRGTGADADTNVNAIGSLYLLSSEDGYDQHIEPTQITETIDGVQSKAWLFAPKPNTTYLVGCTMATTGDDRLWAFSGVTDTRGNALTEIAVGPSLGNVTLNANFTRKTTKTVGTEVRSVVEGDEVPIDSFKVTTPSTPDVPQLGGEGKYITGQQIVATATYADGAMGWAIYTARLARYNDAGAIISEDPLVNQHVNADGYGTITVNPNQFDSNIVIVGIFDRVKCPLSANVHAASAHAFSAFTAQYLGEDGDWHNAVSSSGVVKYGEQVKLHVELADGGFQFEGLYVNGTKSALAPDENGDILYTLENALSFAFVVKAKVSVSMKVVHWADGAKTTGDCKVVLGGTASTGENPVVKDVTLGDTIAYGIDLAERVEGVDWLFDAWYNAVSGEQSYTDPVALPISDDAFAPTAPIDVVARVIDEYILYKTTISFVNEETQDEITAQTDFVESPQDADGKFVNDDNELEFDYRRGAMSVTLNFKETLPGTQLLFTKVQQWLYDEQSGEYGWTDIYNEPSVGFLSNANRKLRALYGSAGNRTVSLAYANGSDRTMGDFFIAEAEGNGKTIEAPRGSQLTLRAVPANGYRFAGWYYAPQAIERIYESTEQVVTVKTTRTLYALFVQDTHAVYEWEGRSDNKMMTWRSKVYVAQIPFNPSAIRVDATDSRGRGTAVNRVEVGMMSSPDSAPAQSGLTVLQNMPNYAARRLPKRRPERYLYVEVQNDAEVDRIIVGTSMEGLRV